ncbi:MAG TPA: TRAP transporter permease [Spirochaetia bacterium]|nr:TRAP transporter permease [Spirochaetales bacterium]HRW24897.1 TRAP transporter permease [Spirochaetia bacterium]
MSESTTNDAIATAEADSQAILKKYDKESNFRVYSGLMAKVISAIAITFTCFQLYTALFGVLDAMLQRAVHLAFGMSLIFLLYPTSQKWSKDRLHPLDLGFAILGALTPMYIIVNYGELVLRAGTATTMDMVVGVIGILLVLEAARRIVGLPIVVIASVFIAYAFAGPWLPGQLAHRGVDVGDLVQHLYFTTEGVFGIPLGVSSTFIFLFILFGAYLEKTGLGQYFIDLANSIAGRSAGGPAKVAVLSSGLMGTVSGSSVANVVGTGSFTIPMMKRLGYKGEFAGAVEATASTGGQLMPPIMGAAAFLMSEMTGIAYVRIIGAAVIPALLYYFGVWAGVHFEAKKLGLRGMTKEELPNLKEIFFGRGYLMIPLVGIVWLLVTGYTPMLAAFYAIVLSIAAAVLGWWAPLPIGGMLVVFAIMKPIFHVGPYGADGALKYLTEMTPLGALAVLGAILIGFAILKKKPNIGFKEIVGGLESGARGAIGVLAATACAGIIIGVVTKTGLGLKLGSVLVSLANGKLILTLFFTMITSIILGMGVPTTANYIITSTIAAPAIIMLLRTKYPELPIDSISIVLPAHMFAFYFGIIADVTPPVALAAFAGAGIAKANPMKTGLNASKLAIAAFLVPYIFVMNPMMLMIDVTLWSGLLMVATSMLGIIGVSSGIMGYLLCRSLWWERILMAAGGVMMIYPGAVTDLIGIGLIAVGVVSQAIRKRAGKAA